MLLALQSLLLLHLLLHASSRRFGRERGEHCTGRRSVYAQWACEVNCAESGDVLLLSSRSKKGFDHPLYSDVLAVAKVSARSAWPILLKPYTFSCPAKRSRESAVAELIRDGES